MSLPIFNLPRVLALLMLALAASAGALAPDLCAQDRRSAEEDTQKVYIAPDEPPAPVGGRAALMLNVRYPEAARRDSITGRVIARFVVTPEGEAEDVSILKKAHPLLDEEAARAIRLTAFEPGTLDGQPVAAWLTMPFTFQIQNPKARASESASGDPASLEAPEETGAERTSGLGKPNTETAYDPGLVEEEPELIGGLRGLQQQVRYPEAARKAEIEGRVVVGFILGKDGRPQDLRVVESAGYAHLDWEAFRVVSQARFKPGKVDGEPVRVKMSLPITFALN